MKKILILVAVLSLTACNSVYMKPGTLDTTKTIYAGRGGFTMKRSIKETMDKRGYNVIVGRANKMTDVVDVDTFYDDSKSEKYIKAEYVVKVAESRELFMPWCIFNGLWWWRFNVSVADQKTGKEILSWRGRGCQNSSIRKLNEILDELEKKD
jgi:hypothetical protein